MAEQLTAVGVVGAFAAMAKVVQAIRDLAKSAEVKAQLTKLYDVIISGQQIALEDHVKQRAMLETIDDLKKEIARVKAWEETKQRYELHQPYPGTFVYMLKEASKGAEPTHWICANCYENAKRSILQLRANGGTHDHYLCPGCNAEVITEGTRHDMGV